MNTRVLLIVFDRLSKEIKCKVMLRNLSLFGIEFNEFNDT